MFNKIQCFASSYNQYIDVHLVQNSFLVGRNVSKQFSSSNLRQICELPLTHVTIRNTIEKKSSTHKDYVHLSCYECRFRNI